MAKARPWLTELTSLIESSGARALPWYHEAARQGIQDVRHRRLAVGDGSVRQELQRAMARADWEVRWLPQRGLFVARERAGADEVSWQLRLPPAMVKELPDKISSDGGHGAVWSAAGKWSADEDSVARLPAAVLLLSAGRAALGFLRPDGGKGAALAPRRKAKNLSKGSGVLAQHKVLTTYAVRGGEKSGTGKFQLFEDQRSGGGGRSEGAKLRRRLAIKFFEDINRKFISWREEVQGDQGWPPGVVHFAGDHRLKHLLLECKNPMSPLAACVEQWRPLPGDFKAAQPSLETLDNAARYLCSGEVVERCAADDAEAALEDAELKQNGNG
eukprot:TRINITY_DN13074_c0_g1_i2.p1 TRINITY_DN13074_c0_g1~~TRINITY_DN13074_c0_g1_i2.p1  ORF type:complete len:329 (+),score=75.02 TRINITY_DN13074_c0_g1_i2:101-1087(+)